MLEGLFSLLSNLMIFSGYVDTKNSFPKPLSKEKENEYLLRAAQGDEEAKELLIRHNLRLVAHITKKYSNYPDTDELISVGSIGLIKAINTFRMGEGTQLATYASRCIENEILMVLRVNKKHNANVSINDSVGVDKDGNEMTIEDVLTIERDSVFEGVENKMITASLMDIIHETLPEREYQIIKMRYGLEDTDPLPQREVAEKFGISRSYISRIEKKALLMLREKVIEEGLFLD